MKSPICSILFLVFPYLLQAQYSPQWVNASPDYFKMGAMLAVDSQDNLVVAGYRPGYAGSANIFTRKFDPAGNLLWEKADSSGLTWKFYKARWVNVDSQDNIIVSGYRYSGTSSEYTDTLVVIKYDPAGNLLWKKQMGHIWPSSLNMRTELDADGNIYLGTVSISPGFNLIKLDPSGNVLHDVANASALNQDFTSMRIKADRVVMTSYAYNGSQVSVCAFDTAGAFLWSTYFASRGGMDVEIDDSLNTYILTQEQHIVTPTSGYDVEIFKFDPAGNQVARFDFDFGGGYDVGTRMTLVNGKISVTGKSILPGQAYMDWITFQTDLAGNKLWDARYGFSTIQDEKPNWVSATPAGDVYVSGQGGPDTVSVTGSSYLRYVTVKYRNGVTMWTDAHPYQGYVGVASAFDSQCGLYVLGETYMTAIHYTDSCYTVGVDEITSASNGTLGLYPNPADEYITLSGHLDQDAEYRIYDVTGREMTAGHLDNHTTLNIAMLKPGIYILRLRGSYPEAALRFVVK